MRIDIITDHIRRVGEGNVFTGVCLFVCSRKWGVSSQLGLVYPLPQPGLGTPGTEGAKKTLIVEGCSP